MRDTRGSSDLAISDAGITDAGIADAAISDAGVTDGPSVDAGWHPPLAPAKILGCIGSDTAAQACAARGRAFRYGPEPYIRCSGVAPRPGEVEAAMNRSRSSACVCNDLAANRERYLQCSRVPSRPPPR